VLRRLDWFTLLMACLLIAAALVLAVIPLARGAAGAAIGGWRDAPLAAFVFPTIGFFLAPIYPVINSVTLSALPPDKHGPMSGLIVIFSALGGTTGSIITGSVFEAYGGRTAFYFSLLPIAILGVCLAFFNRLQKRPASTVTAHV
jgi:fucose permease